jgi:diacylglycerol kinase (ATP)
MIRSNIPVFVNPNSRRGQSSAETLRESLGEFGLKATPVESPEHMMSSVKDAMSQGAEEIWVGGGDGTIGQVAALFAGTDIRLGILPLGTGNALANELGIPSDIGDAIHFLMDTAEPCRIDAGKINDKVFVTVATLGLTSTIAEELKKADKRRFGRTVYVPAAISAVKNTGAFACRILAPNFAYTGPVKQFVAAATRLHGGPFPVSEEASIEDGQLSAYLVEDSSSHLWLIKYLYTLLGSKKHEVPGVSHWETNRITIQSKRELPFIVDGDLYPVREAHIEIMPAALVVLANPGSL